MPKKTKTRKSQVGDLTKLTDEQVFLYAEQMRSHKDSEARSKGEWKKIQDNILVPEFVRRKTKSLGRSGLLVTLVAPESVVYDGPAIKSEKRITWRIKRKIFRRFLVLSDLPVELERKIRDLLVEANQSGKIKWMLDEDALSAQVQEGNINPEVLAEHTEVVPKAKYLNISRGQE